MVRLLLRIWLLQRCYTYNWTRIGKQMTLIIFRGINTFLAKTVDKALKDSRIIPEDARRQVAYSQQSPLNNHMIPLRAREQGYQ